MDKLTLNSAELQLPKATSFNDSKNWSKQQFEKTQGNNDIALQQLEASNVATQKIIDKAKNGQLAQNQDAMYSDKQKRFNDYYMRLNGRVTRDDTGSILDGFVSKDDYNAYMDAAKQYAATQQKPDLSNLAAFQQAMYDRQEARNELNMLNEKRAAQREALGRGIGEFTAMFGDIAKSHGGALVTPRSIDQQLAQLGERERNAYKFYTANQQRIEQDKLAALKEQQAKEDAAAAKEADRNFELKKLGLQQEGKTYQQLVKYYLSQGMSEDDAKAEAKARTKYEGNLYFPSFIVSYEKNGKINKESTNKAIYQQIENYVNKNSLTNPKLQKAWKDAKDLGEKSSNMWGASTKDYEAILNTFIQHNDYDTAIDTLISDWADKNGIIIEKISDKPTVILS